MDERNGNCAGSQEDLYLSRPVFLTLYALFPASCTWDASSEGTSKPCKERLAISKAMHNTSVQEGTSVSKAP